MNRFMAGSLSLLFVFAVTSGLAAENFIFQADRLYAQGEMKNYKRAVALYLKALEDNPNDYEANWKCARAYREYGETAKRKGAEGWKDICAEYGKAGMEHGRRAAELEPQRPEGYYYYGLSVGIYSDGVSIFTALAEGLKSKTQQSFEKAYELDKMFDDAGPILSLGRFWAVVPWPYKDKKKALRYYREYQKTPYFADRDEGKLYLAELLLELKGKERMREARHLLEEVAQSSEIYFRQWAIRLLKKLSKSRSSVDERLHDQSMKP